jgi:PAS domain S-box-containing protein
LENPKLSYSEYQILVEQSPIMIWRCDINMSCDYFNQRWLEFRGRPFDLEKGNGWSEGVHPEDYNLCLKTYMDSFERRQIFEMYYRLLRYDNQYRWIFDRGIPFYDSNGNFEGYLGSCIDVTEKVESEKRLQEAQEAELKTLVSLLPICASCKKIRDDAGYWHSVESYLLDHNKLQLTHGYCPNCMSSILSSTE